ncbi:hypothetical protein EYF80_021435 [Liparis tanakae]|uniref:Uncharacterized protein n=1 Tax=Liparis tanakae TaxID=230148 RepID=A0A4Z2HU20_9TELE|nr:hypothetical protein EYF80_021435 [Liparis tanakae]
MSCLAVGRLLCIRAALAGVRLVPCGMRRQNIQVDLGGRQEAHTLLVGLGRLQQLIQDLQHRALNETRLLFTSRGTSPLPECEFGFEHRLALQSSALSDEQVVVVSLERRLVDIKHFIPQRTEGQPPTRGCPGVGGLSASLSEEMSSASPNRSSAAVFFTVNGTGGGL